jgi:diguanylate cyclase (GGDEF)-like protein
LIWPIENFDQIDVKQRNAFVERICIHRTTLVDMRGDIVTARILALVKDARAIRNRDAARGVALAAEAVDLARVHAQREGDDAKGEAIECLAEALAAKGHCHRVSSELTEAVACCSEAAALFASTGHRYGEALARSQWGIALVQLGNLADGLAQMERSLALSRELGNEEHVSDCLLDIGVVNNMLGNDARAIELYEQARSFFEKSGDHYHHATCLSNAAYAHTCWGRRERAAGQPASALTHFTQAQSLAQRSIDLARLGEDIDFLALRYVTLAEAQREAGDLDACLRTLQAQLPLTETLTSKRAQALCLIGLGDALAERAQGNDADIALEHLNRADKICSEHSIVETQSSVQRSLAKLHEKFDRPVDALAAYKRFHELEIRIHAEDAERDSKTLEAKLRAELAQKELELAKAREAELNDLNRRLRDQQYALERLAHVDALTGLDNRRAWLASLERAWQEGKDSLYVYLLDLDRFKEINDSHGHTVGDTVLSATAQIVVNRIGESGRVGRFGGEEFVAWMRLQDDAHAAELATNVLDALRAHPWRDIAPDLSVTASLGWCSGNACNSPFDALSTADQNMYVAKRAGRDLVIGPNRTNR